jgi:hypothetical protein
MPKDIKILIAKSANQFLRSFGIRIRFLSNLLIPLYGKRPDAKVLAGYVLFCI